MIERGDKEKKNALQAFTKPKQNRIYQAGENLQTFSKNVRSVRFCSVKKTWRNENSCHCRGFQVFIPARRQFGPDWCRLGSHEGIRVDTDSAKRKREKGKLKEKRSLFDVVSKQQEGRKQNKIGLVKTQIKQGREAE